MAKLDQALITKAALEIIEGPPDENDLNLSAIARQLDVTQPALYYHLGGIGDVQRWIGIEVRAALASDLAQATIGLSKADAVRAVAEAWRDFSRRRPEAYRSTQWYPVEGDDELEAAVLEVLNVIAGSLRSFDLDEAQQASAAIALRSTLHGFASFELGAGNPSPDTANASFTNVIDLLITGFEALESGTVARLA